MSNTQHIDYFLDIVAKNYVENEKASLSRYCFVFPNKRSGLYFRRSLRKMMDPPYLEPEVTTISDLVASYSERVTATRYELLFILYRAYCEVMAGKENILTFDKFAYWGEILLTDFDEIQKNFVDAKNLFVNYDRYKGISADYLTDEQKEVLKFYFGDDFNFFGASGDVYAFWKHTKPDDENEKQPDKKFVMIWEILWPLFEKFHGLLDAENLTYSGLDYHNAAIKIKDTAQKDFEFDRYVFVGFNALSKSEIMIFRRLKDIGKADFCWDFNSPAFEKDKNHACYFMRRNIKNFPSLYDCNCPNNDAMPRVRVMGMGSTTGMVKSACKLIKDNITTDEQGKVDYDAASRSALVLPDESLLLPVMNSLDLPQSRMVNITMGYPLSMTPIAALINDIARLHINARKVKNEILFYVDNVVTILSNPIIRAIADKECDDLLRHLRNNRIFNVPKVEFEQHAPSLTAIFTPINDLKSGKEVFDYLDAMTDSLAKGIVKNKSVEDEDVDVDELLRQPKTLNEIFLNHYRLALRQLRRAADRYEVEIKDEKLLFRLVERAMGNDSISFTGEPIGGLQILGVLETRAINFSDVYILSMNESVFPKKHFSRSFIPDAFRRAYFLPTVKDQEAMSAYYFYRLISRANNVYLYYVTSNSGMRVGEPSRYITQLQYLFPGIDFAMDVIPSAVASADDKTISVKKDTKVVGELNELQTIKTGENVKNNHITASALKTYLNCRLAFYFGNVKRIRVKDEAQDFIDDATLGNIVHRAFEFVYKEGETYNKDRLEQLAGNRCEIKRIVTKAVNEKYLGIKEDDSRIDNPLTDEAKLVSDHVCNYIIEILKAEANSNFLPFTYVAHEDKTENVQITLEKGGKKITFNVKQYIDRIDSFVKSDETKVLRIIDYKTGSDDPAVGNNWQQKILRDNTAVFQLLFYCEVVRQLKHEYEYKDYQLKPLIYQVRNIPVEGVIKDITFNGTVVDNYDDYRDDFRSILFDIVNEIFDENVPFDQSSYKNGRWDEQAPYAFDTKSCKFCNFQFICNKKVDNNSY